MKLTISYINIKKMNWARKIMLINQVIFHFLTLLKYVVLTVPF